MADYVGALNIRNRAMGRSQSANCSRDFNI